MAEEIAFENGKDIQLSRACDLDLGSCHTAYRRASLIDLHIHAKFHWNQRNFLWAYGRTDVWDPLYYVDSRVNLKSATVKNKHSFNAN